jgi:hypothetical protein
MNEDVTTVSPTLGFIIKTIDYEGYVDTSHLQQWMFLLTGVVKLQAQHLYEPRPFPIAAF